MNAQLTELQIFSTATSVDVYKNDSVFDSVEQYWKLPMHILQSLYIGTYQLKLDEYGEVANAANVLAELKSKHPNDLLFF